MCFLGWGLEETEGAGGCKWGLTISVGPPEHENPKKYHVRQMEPIIKECKIDQEYVRGPPGILKICMTLENDALHHLSPTNMNFVPS